MKKLSIPVELFFSTLKVLMLSTIGALCLWFFGFDFIPSFCLVFVFQYILFSFIGNIINNYYIQKTKQKELEALEPLSTILECAYCNTKNLMTFLPDQNERMEFGCSSCNKKNVVNIQFVVARTTEPVTVSSATNIPLINDEK
jgi:transcription elongation factor Elf1